MGLLNVELRASKVDVREMRAVGSFILVIFEGENLHLLCEGLGGGR